jgi:hypothetical protein
MAWWAFFRGRRRSDAANGEPSTVAGRAARIRRDLAADGEAAAEAIGDLKHLEQRYGPSVAPAAVRLRSAVLMHRFGRKSEAWEMFRRLLEDPSACGDPAVRPIVQSEIYNRMRMALEREGCVQGAVTPAVLAYVLRVFYVTDLGREHEAAQLRTPERFEKHFAPLLTRARLTAHLTALRTLVLSRLKSDEGRNLGRLADDVEQLLAKPAAPAGGSRSREAG